MRPSGNSNLRAASPPEWGSASTHSNLTTSPLPGTEDAPHLPACETPPYSATLYLKGRKKRLECLERPAAGALGGSKLALARSTHGSLVGGVRWVVA